MNSRILSVDLSVDPVLDEDGKIKSDEPSCFPSKEVLQKKPVRYRMEHSVKAKALRKINFHENEPNSDVSRLI